MRILTTSAVALGAVLLIGLTGTSPSFAKGHNQGMNSTTSTEPGTNVGSETVTNSQQEGSMQGKADPSNSPVGAGNSENAGRSTSDSSK